MLMELAEYGRKLGGEPGFRVRDVKWCIDLAVDGTLLGVIPLGDGKRGQQLAACPDMHGMNSGGKAHFLVEQAQHAVLLLSTDSSATPTPTERHAHFLATLQLAAAQIPELATVVASLASTDVLERIRSALAAAKAKPNEWVTWRVAGKDPRESAVVQTWWRQWRAADLAANALPIASGAKSAPARMVCLLTGELVEPLPSHSTINKLRAVGGLAPGDRLIGFDKAAFRSFGLEKSANAAMKDTAAQTYVDALNDLIENRSDRLINALVMHWFKEQIEIKDDPFSMLHSIADDDQAAIDAREAAKRLLTAIRTGQRTDLSGNRYFAITLSGASGRVMIRDWMVGSFETLLSHVSAWFDDLEITRRDGQAIAPPPKFLAVCGGLVRENLKDLPAPAIASLWHAAAFGRSIPPPLMSQALSLLRSDIIKAEPFNHARMGLIKAYFIRKPNGGDPHMHATVNEEHPMPAYHCGRLLAVLAGLQRAALGDVGAGVVQRFYAAFSQTPGLVLGRVASNARNHLNKLEPKLAWWYEEQIANIMGRLGNNAPRTLDLEGQGLFALGYYQQLASLRTSKKPVATVETHSTVEPIQTQGTLL